MTKTKIDAQNVIDKHKEEWFKIDGVRMICVIPKGKSRHIILIGTDGEPTEEIKRKIGTKVNGVEIDFEKIHF